MTLCQILKVLVVPAALLYAGSASAFFDAEVMAGKRWYQEDTSPKASNISAQDVSAAVHLDPIPLIPVAFGARFDVASLNTNDVKGATTMTSVSNAAISEVGLDIMGWVPMVPIVTPYGRLTIPLMGKAAIKGKAANPVPGGADVDVAQTATVSGMHIGLGVKYSPIPLIKILAEMQKGTEKYKVDEYKINDIKQSTPTYNLNSNAFYLGVEIGI